MLQLSSKLSFITWFTVNQTQIIEDCCINKNKPELNCNAKCYLTNNLAKQDETATNQPNSSKLKQHTEEVLYCEENNTFNLPSFITKVLSPKKQFVYFYQHISNVFEPPKA